MEKKNKLAKMALAALVLASSLPVAGQAANDKQDKGTFLAGGCAGGCGASTRGGCGAATTNDPRANPNSDMNSNSGMYTTPGTHPADSSTHGSGMNSGHVNPNTKHADPLSYNTDRNYNSSYNNPNAGMNSSYNNPNSGYNSNPNYSSSGYNSNSGYGGMSSGYQAGGQSSYQGTTTGPGPNDGYPGTPRGSYNTDSTHMMNR